VQKFFAQVLIICMLTDIWSALKTLHKWNMPLVWHWRNWKYKSEIRHPEPGKAFCIKVILRYTELNVKITYQLTSPNWIKYIFIFPYYNNNQRKLISS
jgi:hypothetical protein